MVDALSVFFIVATAANLILLWLGSPQRVERGSRASSASKTLNTRVAQLSGKRTPEEMPSKPAREIFRDRNSIPQSHPSPAVKRRNPFEEVQRKIADGISVEEVSRQVGLTKGEIDLFLKLNRYRQLNAA